VVAHVGKQQTIKQIKIFNGEMVRGVGVSTAKVANGIQSFPILRVGLQELGLLGLHTARALEVFLDIEQH